MEMYGIANSIMEANTLHGQIALNEELAQQKYQLAQEKFNKTIKDAKANDSQSNEVSEASDLPDLNALYVTGKGVYSGVRGAAQGAKDAYNLAQQGIVTGQGVRNAAGGLSDAAQSAFLAASDGGGALAGGARVAVAAAQDTGYVERAGAALSSAGAALSSGVETARTGLSIAQGAATGFKTGVAATGGAATAFGDTLSGVEGIVQKGLVKFGGGEGLGFIAGKAAGAAGGLITAGTQIDSLIESGGKSAFTRVNDQGQRVAMSGVDKASEFLNEAGALADVTAAATGGLLVPVAAALNLAGAITGVIGSYQDEKTDDKGLGLNPDGTTNTSKGPKLGAPVATEAFTGLGFVGNMTHNPLAHIA